MSRDAQHNMEQELVCEELPQDILHHIHSLLLVRDAARVACVSRGFLRSWRCYSKLILNDDTLELTDKKFENREPYIINKVGQILENHHSNGVKVETLKLDLGSSSNIKASSVDRWLQIIVKSGIKELDLWVPMFMKENYSFPCSVFSDEEAATSIQTLRIFDCHVHPMLTLGHLRRLTCLKLSSVRITDEELGLLLSRISALEWLDLFSCSGIIRLRIPCTLQQLNSLCIMECMMLQVVEVNAPNLCSFHCGAIHYRRTCIEILFLERRFKKSPALN
ncbi:uncharacterized protein [Triticum aestivum]|uniref:uncharacterized protein n=1 Tax=Triticum aestivum TaxID=4565 RepID=UPI001D0137D0|nr:uncharacterized protein LOC123048135 [Triticum aestivum]